MGTGIQQTGMSRTPNEVSLSMPAIRFDVAVYGIIYGNIFRVTVESWQCGSKSQLRKCFDHFELGAGISTINRAAYTPQEMIGKVTSSTQQMRETLEKFYPSFA